MPDYDYHCDRCDRDKTVTRPMAEAGLKEMCHCGHWMRRVFQMPQVSFNHWRPDYTQMDGEKEAIAAGMDE